MLSRIPDKNIWLVYATIFLLGIAYGVALSVLAVYLDARGLREDEIGSLAFWFALGIASLAVPMGAIIRKISARATLVASLGGYAIAIGVFPFLRGYPALAVDRFLDGAFSAGVWVSCETILLSRADARNKAFVTSLYAISLALGYCVGPLLAAGIVSKWPTSTVFVVAAVLAVSAALVLLARLDADVPETHEPSSGAPAEEGAKAPTAPATSSGALFKSIKTSCLATFTYGYFQASLVSFLPLFLMKTKGVTKGQTIIVPAIFSLGMVLFSNVAGRLGDRHGHLRVMRALACVGTVMVLGFVYLESYALMGLAVFVAGATLAAISPVSLALQGVIAAPRDYSRANALYNVCYAAGMLIGPLVAGKIFRVSGGVMMLYHMVALWTAFIVFTIVFAKDDPAARRAAAAGAVGS